MVAWRRILAAFSLLWTSVIALSTTASRSQLVSDLQKCLTPSDVLHRVGRHVTPRVDQNGSLSSLVLTRLSKQFITIDNLYGNNGEKWVNEVLGDTTETTLSSITSCLSEAELPSSLHAVVDGTKAACVISRLLPGMSSSIYHPLQDCWNHQASDVASLLGEHHLSGLQWAFDSLSLSYPSMCLPKEIDEAYKDIKLPFRILPWFAKSLDDLSIDRLTSEVQFRVDDIRTPTNTVVKERRQTAWEGDEHVAPFAYAGKEMIRQDWSPVVRSVRDQLYRTTGQYYDGCLLNLYPDGGSGMRYHIDPDQGTLWDYDTVVVSVGASRRFAFRQLTPKQGQPHNFVVFHGDVTYMCNDCQERFQHTVKKAENKNDTAARASLVFKRTWNYERS